MTVRADHVAAAAFLALGLFVFIVGADLPFGSLSQPSAGMLPKLVAGLIIAFALVLAVSDRTSPPVASIRWSDFGHAVQLVLIAAVGVALYTRLGFLITMSLLVFALLVLVERRGALRAGIYSVGLTLFAYWLFDKMLKAPLERGLLGF
jgi:hypothetical protein